MPEHRIGFDALEATVDELLKTERIVKMTGADDGSVVVTTEARVPLHKRAPGEKETR